LEDTLRNSMSASFCGMFRM